MLRTRKTLGVIALATAVLVTPILAGCATAAPAPEKTSAAPLETVSIKVGLPLTANAASAYLAMQGAFKDQALDVTPVKITSGAEAIPLLLNGGLDVALGDGIGTLTAASNGVPLAVFGIATVQPKDPNLDPTGLFAADKSVTFKDLNGQPFAVSQLGGAAELIAKAAIDAEGGDSSKVNFVELASEQMAAAIQAGTIKAALITEPYATAAEKQGLYVLDRPTSVGGPGLPATTWITTLQYGAQHADVLARFAKAVQEAGIAANKDSKSARAAAKTYMTAPAAVIDSIRFPVFSENVGDTAGMLDFVKLANKYKVFAKQPDMNQILSIKVTTK